MPNEIVTFREWLTNAGEGGPIEAVQFTEPCGWYGPPEDEWRGIPLGQILTAEQAEPWFQIPFNSGFGGQQCPNVSIWTRDRVYYVHEYDGSTRLHWIDRNPPKPA